MTPGDLAAVVTELLLQFEVIHPFADVQKLMHEFLHRHRLHPPRPIYGEDRRLDLERELYIEPCMTVMVLRTAGMSMRACWLVELESKQEAVALRAHSALVVA